MCMSMCTHTCMKLRACVCVHICVCTHTLVPNRCVDIYCKVLVTVDKEIDRSQISRANGQAADNNCFHSLRTEFVP